MGWKSIGNGRYYYRARRIGNRVESEYVGSGLYAELRSEADLRAQAERKAEQARRRQERAEYNEIERQLDQAEGLTYDLVKAAYLLGGYYQHRRQWRKRNAHRDNRGSG
jgi:hypothetical protein